MQDDGPRQRWLSRLALPVSAGLHLAVLALLVFGLPRAFDQPDNDQAIDVDLVPLAEAPSQPAPPPPPAAAEKPQEEEAQPPPPAQGSPEPQSPVPSISPVFQYGEKDSGPEKSLEGNSAAEESASEAEQPSPDDQAPAKEEADATAAEDTEIELSLPDTAALPTARPTEAKETRSAPELKQAKKLFSRSANEDPLATTAMGDLPRSARGAALCVNELGQQLRHNAPAYFADLLPSSRLESGTVLDVPGVAFHADGQWRDLSYRCEVDADVTKVVSFAFRIGEPIPRSEWRRRGLRSR